MFQTPPPSAPLLGLQADPVPVSDGPVAVELAKPKEPRRSHRMSASIRMPYDS